MGQENLSVLSPSQAIAVELDAIIVERGVRSRIELLAGYWEAGRAIRQHPDSEKKGTIKQILAFMSYPVEQSTLYRAVQWYDLHQDWGGALDGGPCDIPDLILGAYDKDISWRKVIREILPQSEKEETRGRPTKEDRKERQETAYRGAVGLSEARRGNIWTNEHHSAFCEYLRELMLR